MTKVAQGQETRKLNAEKAIEILENNGYSRDELGIGKDGLYFASYVRGWQEFQVIVDYDKYLASKPKPEFSRRFLENVNDLAALCEKEDITFKVICGRNRLGEVQQQFGKSVTVITRTNGTKK